MHLADQQARVQFDDFLLMLHTASASEQWLLDPTAVSVTDADPTVAAVQYTAHGPSECADSVNCTELDF